MEYGTEFIQLRALDSAIVGAKMNCDGFLFSRFYPVFRSNAKTHTSSAIAPSLGASHELERYASLFSTYFHRIAFCLPSMPTHDFILACTTRQTQVVMISHSIHSVTALDSLLSIFFTIDFRSSSGNKTIRGILCAASFSRLPPIRLTDCPGSGGCRWWEYGFSRLILFPSNKYGNKLLLLFVLNARTK